MKEGRRRPSVRALLLLCVVLLGLGGWLLFQRNQAWDREQRQKELMLVDFSVQVTDAGAYAYWVAKDITDFTFGDCLASFDAAAQTAQRLGDAGVLPEEDARQYQAYFEQMGQTLRQGGKTAIPTADMEKLMMIDRQEAFWADGAPYDDFAAYMAK